MATTRIIITGCRHWKCGQLAASILERLQVRYGTDLVVVLGGASGVDESFRVACEVMGIACEVHPADWEWYGRGAGPIRNQAMVDAGAAFAIAVHRDLFRSRGTLNCVCKCAAAGIDVWHVDGTNPMYRFRPTGEHS